ncbi:MAG TPA: S28 family serine protease [Kofleriaceae bacterium]|nr:S28 family serine protease [Kofleriaceae bacterium]
MSRAPRRLALALLLAAACGDNEDGPPGAGSPDATPAEEPDAAPPAVTCDEETLAASLAALPDVTSASETDCGDYVVQPARCFAIEMQQPVDHAAATGPTFGQRLFLIHRGCDRPALVADWGYSNEYFYDFELSLLYQTNNLWIEHRFQGQSVPDTADWDWSALTIENGAADMHRVIAAFRELYGGRWVSTGASKGGITATYHRYHYPDDLDGSVPYVAPASRARVDPAYQVFLADSLPAACADRVRDAQVAALTSRRTMMVNRLTEYSGPGGEEALLEQLTANLDWSFWQAWGESYCSQVPRASATNARFWQFYLDFSYLAWLQAPGAPDETMKLGALYYEWLTEQGFALQVNDRVAPLLEDPSATASMEDQFRELFPDVVLPPYDGSLTAAVRDWVRDEAGDMLFIYGQYDPWSGGAMAAPEVDSSARYFVPGATHAAQIGALPEQERAAAMAIATRLFGTEPAEGLREAAARAGADHLRRLQHQLQRDLATPLRLRLGR